MTTRDEAAIAAARTEARDAIAQVRKLEQQAADQRARRDSAILAMYRAGVTVPEITRALEIPSSTVRQGYKSALARSASN